MGSSSRRLLASAIQHVTSAAIFGVVSLALALNLDASEPPNDWFDSPSHDRSCKCRLVMQHVRDRNPQDRKSDGLKVISVTYGEREAREWERNRGE